MTSHALARQGGWRAQLPASPPPRPAWAQKERIEFEELESSGSDGGWTVGYLDVLLILVTLFAALLGATFLQMDGLRSALASETLPLAMPVAPAAPLAAARTGEDPGPAGNLVPATPGDPGTPSLSEPDAGAEPALPAPTVRALPPIEAAAIDPGPASEATAPSLAGTSAAGAVQTTEPDTMAAAPTPAPVTTAATTEPPAPVAAAAPATPPEFQAFMDLVAAHGERQNLELLLDRHQLRLEVGNDILFPSGTADLVGAGRNLLADLADALADDRLEISVEGHTDDVPINTARFPSNWELSSIRASTVARELIALGIPEHRLRVTGHADTRPRATNDSPANRALNRRVSLVLEVADAPLLQE